MPPSHSQTGPTRPVRKAVYSPPRGNWNPGGSRQSYDSATRHILRASPGTFRYNCKNRQRFLFPPLSLSSTRRLPLSRRLLHFAVAGESEPAERSRKLPSPSRSPISSRLRLTDGVKVGGSRCRYCGLSSSLSPPSILLWTLLQEVRQRSSLFSPTAGRVSSPLSSMGSLPHRAVATAIICADCDSDSSSEKRQLNTRGSPPPSLKVAVGSPRNADLKLGSRRRMESEGKPISKLVTGDNGYVLEDVPHLTDFIADLHVSFG